MADIVRTIVIISFASLGILKRIQTTVSLLLIAASVELIICLVYDQNF